MTDQEKIVQAEEDGWQKEIPIYKRKLMLLLSILGLASTIFLIGFYKDYRQKKSNASAKEACGTIMMNVSTAQTSLGRLPSVKDMKPFTDPDIHKAMHVNDSLFKGTYTYMGFRFVFYETFIPDPKYVKECEDAWKESGYSCWGGAIPRYFESQTVRAVCAYPVRPRTGDFIYLRTNESGVTIKLDAMVYEPPELTNDPKSFKQAIRKTDR